jgi:hypothetical protein
MFFLASRGTSNEAIDTALATTLTDLGGPPSFVLCVTTASVDVASLQCAFDPSVPFHDSSFCPGIMTHEGAFIDQEGSSCVIDISFPNGAYRSSVVPVECAAQKLLLQALAQTQRPG